MASWNYYQTTETEKNTAFVEACKKKYSSSRVTSDPAEADYDAVYLWKAACEKAGSFEVDDVIKAIEEGGISFDAPEGTVAINGENNHLSKPVRIGEVGADGLILQQAARSIFGTQGVNVNAPSFLQGGITIGGCTFSYNRLFIILMVALCLFGVWFIMYKSNFGKQMRAVMQNRTMAQCMGINSRKVDNVTFSIGSGLAGIAGCAVALLGSIDSTVGQSYIVNSFIAVVLGGVEKLLGTVIGSTIIGSASIFTENYTSSTIAKVIVLLIVIIFLQKRPQGLFVIRRRNLDV